MKEEFKAKLALLPDKAGIYLFKNEKGEFIYVGKARSLRDRVKSYFQPSPDAKVGSIIAETADIDFILTGSEREAAFLENNFIQRYQPKFNLRLKDDKSFPYLKLTLAERFPGIYLTRKVEPGGARYFGPFSPASQARKTIHLLNKYFGIRACEEKIPGNRRRPCLEYDLKLCAAPCVGEVSEAEYRERVANAVLFLEGKTERLLEILKGKMKAAAEHLDYEQAARWRDLIRTIDQIKDRPKLISVALEDADIFGLAREKERAAVYGFFMRKGKVRQAEETVFRSGEEETDAAVLSRFLSDYYVQADDIPARILLPVAPEIERDFGDSLSRKKGSRVRIFVPQKGRDRKLVELAERNAEILLEKSAEDLPSLVQLGEAIGLHSPPRRIEGFDVSNTGGDESVGSLVVFERGRPKTDDYRKYKIKSVAGPNDVQSLAEIVRRRYHRVLEEGGELPDLVLVDGGKGQLQAAAQALHSVGLGGLSVISLAKREEIIFIRGRKDGLRLDRTSPALKLLQYIRDEAHRFAVSYHRRRREKKSFLSGLDGIAGLGEKRKKALLSQYRSLAEIRQAALEDLIGIVGKKAAAELKRAVPDNSETHKNE
jgi:excinuclease ABC subunit C